MELLKRHHAWAALVLLSGCTTSPYQTVSPFPEPQSPYLEAIPAVSEVVPMVPDIAPTANAEHFYLAGMQSKASGDYQSMLDALMAAADLDHAQACYELARLLTEGKIVFKDVASARLYLERSAALGNPEALRVLAWNYLRGEYGPADLQQGSSLMHLAASQSVRAQRELGMLYANVYRPHLNDLSKAEHFLLLAAESADGEAAYQLARLKQGNGEVIDAVTWYEAANAKGHTKAGAALTALSEGTAAGAGLAPMPMQHAQQPLDSAKLYRQATAILTQGRRTLEQEARAYAMFSIASDQGHQESQQELFFLSGVKTLMDRKNPAWLDEERQKITTAQSPQPKE